ncbi:hypothetical protein [Arcobacter sp. LA11]|uniref:hypothetical protein n=1 Tax=Arcobacter sp. LA11 TaxID=1898176 RepID=UPI000933BCFB|nr:hypothetical protein [Arcobacter sp. LA11]
MIKNIKKYIYEPKSNIGWGHGLLACIGAVCCAYLTMMLFSALMYGDYAYQIIPSIILTPILMTAYGLWLLFSEKIIDILKKISFSSIFLIIAIYLSIKVF